MATIDNGSISAHIFVGLNSKYCDVFDLVFDKRFVNTLWDVVRKRGTMDKLVSDRAQLEVSKKVKDNLRHLCIDDWQSEAQFQHHKFAELRYQETKFIY